MPMRVEVNGKPMELDGIRTIADLLRMRALNPSLVAVEHNGEIVRREQFETREVREGDKLEIVHFVGGG